MCDFNPHSLEFSSTALTPDDPHAPRRYPRDLFADDDKKCEPDHLHPDDLVS